MLHKAAHPDACSNGKEKVLILFLSQELAKAEMLACIKEEPLRPVTKKVGVYGCRGTVRAWKGE